MTVARVVLDSPLPQLDRVFEYAVPAALEPEVAAGVRVRVPLRTGGRIIGGYVLEVAEQAEFGGELAALAEVVSPVPVLTPEIAQLARAVADRQAGVMSDVLRLAVPVRSARLEERWWADTDGSRAARAAAAADAGAGARAAGAGDGARAAGAGGGAGAAGAGAGGGAGAAGAGAGATPGLGASDPWLIEQYGAEFVNGFLASLGEASSEADAPATAVASGAKAAAAANAAGAAVGTGAAANAAAGAAANAAAAAAGAANSESPPGPAPRGPAPRGAVPPGVARKDAPARLALRVPTGVEAGVPRALRAVVGLAACVVAAGHSALVLVPDFRDLEFALAAASSLVSAERVRRVDAALKPMPRYAEFLRALEPVPQLLIGTRAAVYTPAHRLGAVFMWDDDDESFIEPRAPHAHAREVALMRATQQRAAVVLAGHAPSLEARRLVQTGWLREVAPLRLTKPRVLPAGAILDGDDTLRSARIPSAAWRAAKDALQAGPVLVQVGRAGYRPRLACAQCGAAAVCTNCGGPLGQADAGRVPACRVCGRLHANWGCPSCGGSRLRAAGIGHERTAEELGRAFPGVPVVVADAEARIVRLDDRPRLVVATRGAEPVPTSGYAAVLLLDTEAALARETLDATDHALRAWSNAAALAADDGTVLIAGGVSTPVVALRDWQQPRWADVELAARRELAFPPAVRVGIITGSETEVAAAVRRVTDLDGVNAQVLGPTADPDEPDRNRAVIRFDYRSGSRVAAALRTELVARATRSRAASARTGTSGPRPGAARASTSTLRVHLDAPDVF